MLATTAIAGLLAVAAQVGTLQVSAGPHAAAGGLEPRLREHSLAGLPLAAAPFFRSVRVVYQGQAIWAGLDTTDFPGLVGTSAKLYVVDDKSLAQWIANPVLMDVAGGPKLVTFAAGGLASNQWLLDSGALSGDAGLVLGRGYDVVLDLDQDGQLDPLEPIDGSLGAGFSVWLDPSLNGPLATSEATYSGGTFLGQVVYYPTSIASLGLRPLVVFSHGNGHSYLWYGHVGRHLASWGFVVMSHQNDTMPGTETAATTTLTNTDYFLGNLGSIAGGALAGHVDPLNVAWIGHSRGGEGVVRAWYRLSTGNYLASNYAPDSIRFVCPMAPVTFLAGNTSTSQDRPFCLLYGAADSDVQGAPSTGSKPFAFYERADGPKSLLYLQGVGHAWFHSGGGSCFCSGPSLIGEAQTHVLQKSYLLALCSLYQLDNSAARDFVERSFSEFQPPSTLPGVVAATEHRPALGRFSVIDDFQTQSSLLVSSSGGSVTFSVVNLVEGDSKDEDGSFDFFANVPLNGMTRRRAGDLTDTQRAAVFDVPPGASAYYELELVAALRDCASREALSFRLCQGTRHPHTDQLASALSMAVTLRDGAGASSTLSMAPYASVTRPYLRTGYGSGTGWANEFCTVRVPLAHFGANGVALDLKDVRAVRLEFGPPLGSAPGRIGLDDVLLLDP